MHHDFGSLIRRASASLYPAAHGVIPRGNGRRQKDVAKPVNDLAEGANAFLSQLVRTAIGGQRCNSKAAT